MSVRSTSVMPTNAAFPIDTCNTSDVTHQQPRFSSICSYRTGVFYRVLNVT